MTVDSKVKRAKMSESIKRNKGISHATAKEIAKSMNYIIDVEDYDMPHTVFQTTDEIVVMEAVQSLIKDHVDYTDDTAPDYKMFNDPEFKPNDSAIYSQSDLSQSEKKEFIDDYLHRIQWLRPKQISEEVEFDSLPESKVPDLRIVQGRLKNNWFLSALSLVRTEDTLFQSMTLDHQFDRFRTYGLYVFKFFKNGSPFYVIIDDKLPWIEKPNGHIVPYFARSQNSSLFWVSLIEKAYAKLHKRYWALTNGTVEDALHDLWGIYPERFPIDFTNFTDSNKLYDALKILCLSGALVGSSLIYDRVEISEAQKQKEINNSITKGIQPGVYYSILDCREVTLKETTNKTAKIIRVQNPWKDAIEWTGDFNDDDPIWSPKMKTYFESLSSNKTNERYVHRWFSNDGIFCMKIEDFAEYFNTIYIVRDFPEDFEGVKYSNSWNPSNGHPHKKNTDWIKNPQYIFKVNDQSAVDFKI